MNDDNLIAALAKLMGVSTTQLSMRAAVGDTLMRDVVNDSRKSKQPSSIAKNEPGQSRNGWANPPQISDWRPSGQRYLDQMMDAQDAKDRAARVKEVIETRAMNITGGNNDSGA